MKALFLLVIFSFILVSCNKLTDEIRISAKDGVSGVDGIDGLNGHDGIDGLNGLNGRDGANGHSLVSQYMPATELECSINGSRLDIYIDMDDSLTPSEGDIYQNSLIACNGANGLDGRDGVDGQDGADGMAGPPGVAGPPGLNGNPGHDGLPGPQGPPGTPGSPGHDGKDGKDGNDGKDGKDGNDGEDGDDGEDGKNGKGKVVPKNVTGTCSNISTNYDALIKNNTVEIYTANKNCTSQHKVYVLTSAASSFWLSNTELAVFVEPAGLRILSFE